MSAPRYAVEALAAVRKALEAPKPSARQLAERLQQRQRRGESLSQAQVDFMQRNLNGNDHPPETDR